jgi:hypothetical protein
MVGFLRLVVFGFIGLSIIYLWMSFSARSAQRRTLRAQWDEQGMTGDKDAYVAAGMQVYERSLRHKLIVMVYVIPVIVIGTIIYLTNYY